MHFREMRKNTKQQDIKYPVYRNITKIYTIRNMSPLDQVDELLTEEIWENNNIVKRA